MPRGKKKAPVKKGHAIRSEGPPEGSESEQDDGLNYDAIPETPEATLELPSGTDEDKALEEKLYSTPPKTPSPKKRKTRSSDESPESKKKKKDLSMVDYLEEEGKTKKKKKKASSSTTVAVAPQRVRRKDAEIISDNRRNAQSMIATTGDSAVLNELDVMAKTFVTQMAAMKKSGVSQSIIDEYARANIDSFQSLQKRKQEQGEIATKFLKEVCESTETVGTGKQKMDKYGPNFKISAAAILQNGSNGIGSNFVASGAGKNSISAVQGIAQRNYGSSALPIAVDEDEEFEVAKPGKFEEVEE